MSTKEVIVYVCDVCGSDRPDVETHLVALDGTAVEVEVCERDWQTVMETVAVLGKVGRKPKLAKVSQRKNIQQFPGLPWDFTSHALIRMGERHIRPADAVEAAEDPTTAHPGKDPALEVRARNGVKAVVDVRRRLIVTVSKRDEDVEEVA